MYPLFPLVVVFLALLNSGENLLQSVELFSFLVVMCLLLIGSLGSSFVTDITLAVKVHLVQLSKLEAFPNIFGQ